MPPAVKPDSLPSWHSQAPANTMILGEHSVVYGHPALACAVNQFVKITWHARADNALNIYSALGQHHTQIDAISLHPKLNFAVAALQAFQYQLPHGLDIHIESEFSSTIGLGSSAAVLAAMLSGLNTICQTKHELIALFTIGHKIIIDIQGRGSGTDLAASLSGGAIYFQPKNETHKHPVIKKITVELPIQLFYCGYKTPTAVVLQQVAEAWQNKPAELSMLYRAMAKTTRTGFEALQNNTFSDFYQACKKYQQLMTELGVNDSTLQTIIDLLTSCPSIDAAKISGSGLGDCVLAIGVLDNCSTETSNRLNNYQQISVNICEKGAFTLCDSNYQA
ncbi:GHMP kinase [Thiomicrorhabdus sp.]|uniref:mevalonate kinase family protein n=1 Tax=Thiomicrorhabdus sp. TaxID=2039724 RepID=UPI002AA9202F|nr:GHMP kinase [Thiomicrorhabdus sp.]